MHIHGLTKQAISSSIKSPALHIYMEYSKTRAPVVSENGGLILVRTK